MTKLQEKCDNLRKSIGMFRQTKTIRDKISAVNTILKDLAPVMGTVRALRQNYITKMIVENEKEKSLKIRSFR